MILAIMESNSGGNDVAFLDAGVDAHARPAQNSKALDRARSRSEIVVRIFGVQADLDGVANRARRLAFQAAAARDVNLQLDQIEAGRALGHRVLDLQPRVHLHERRTCWFSGW